VKLIYQFRRLIKDAGRNWFSQDSGGLLQPLIHSSLDITLIFSFGL